MAEDPAEPLELSVDRVEVAESGSEKIIVRVVGSGSGGDAAGGAILVVEARGHAHRFAPIPHPRRTVGPANGEWSVSFSVPAWLRLHLTGETWLSVGGSVVALPAPSEASAAAEPSAEGEPPANPEDEAPAAERLVVPPVLSDEPPPDEGYLVNALRQEAQERAAEEARLRGALADANAELAARNATIDRFHSVQQELREELERLRELVTRQDDSRAATESRAMVLAADLADAQQRLQEAEQEQESLRQQVIELRVAAAAGEAARAEAEGLKAELTRLAEDLAHAREQLGTEDAGLDEAEALLAEARALTDTLRER